MESEAPKVLAEMDAAAKARDLILSLPERNIRVLPGFFLFLAALFCVYLPLYSIVHYDAPSFVLFVGIFGGMFLFREGYRYWRYSIQGAIRKDQRPIALLCRPFKVDKYSRFPLVEIIGHAIVGLTILKYFRQTRRPGSIEEYIEPVVRLVGPFVAIGSPMEQVPRLGAHRLYCSEDQWQDTFERLIDGACLIVAIAPTSDYAYWEIQQVITRGALHKLFIAFGSVDWPPRPYSTFKQASAELFPHPLPERLGSDCVLHFSFSGVPVVTSAKRRLRDRLYEDPLADAMWRALEASNFAIKMPNFRPRSSMYLGLFLVVLAFIPILVVLFLIFR